MQCIIHMIKIFTTKNMNAHIPIYIFPDILSLVLNVYPKSHIFLEDRLLLDDGSELVSFRPHCTCCFLTDPSQVAPPIGLATARFCCCRGNPHYAARAELVEQSKAKWLWSRLVGGSYQARKRFGRINQRRMAALKRKVVVQDGDKMDFHIYQKKNHSPYF